MKVQRSRWVRGGIAVLVAVGLVGLITALSMANPPDDDTMAEARDQNEVVRVETVSVADKELQRTSTQPATVHPYYRTEIRAKVSGYVKELKADIGDVVEAGDALAVIHVPELQKQREIIQARIARLEAEEKQAEAGVQLSKAQVHSAEAKVAQAKSEMNRAEASLAAAEAEFDRTRDLVERQSLQDRVLDEVRKKRDSERASKVTAASAIDSAEADVTVAEAQQAAAEADLQAARAETDVTREQLEEAEVLLEYATLKAPFDAVVTARSVNPGDLVRETSEVGKGEPLFVLSQVDKVRVHVPVPEKDAPFVNRGDSLTLRFPSFSAEDPITATVTRLSGSLDPSTRTMLVEAEIDNPKQKLLPGMFGQATITLSTKTAANVLPARAVRFGDDGQAYVYAVGPDQRVSIHPVTTGDDNGATIEILSGVEPGQKVIDAHLKRFTDGQQVAEIAGGS